MCADGGFVTWILCFHVCGGDWRCWELNLIPPSCKPLRLIPSSSLLPTHISSVYTTNSRKGTRGVPDSVTVDIQCKQSNKQSSRLATPLCVTGPSQELSGRCSLYTHCTVSMPISLPKRPEVGPMGLAAGATTILSEETGLEGMNSGWKKAGFQR